MLPTKSPEVLEQLANLSGALAPRQLQLARFIHQNVRKAAFMNSVELAHAAGVSNPTVVRLAFRLGFSGFPEFQKALQKTVERDLNSLEKYSGETDGHEEDLFQKVLSLEFHVLREMKEKLSEESVRKVVGLLGNARHVFVVGLLANKCLAEYLAYFLSILRENVHLLTHFDHEAYGQVKDAGKDAVAILYSFPRYPAGTQSLARIFREEGVPVVGITDSGMSPLSPIADVLLEAPMKFITFIDPCAGAFALTHALLTAFYMKNPDRMRSKLRTFENFAAGSDLFLRKDIDIVELV